MKEALTPFDMVEVLDGPEATAEYLAQVLAEGDTDELVRARGHMARAQLAAHPLKQNASQS